MSGFVGAASMLERLLEEELAGAGLAQALEDEGQLRSLCAPTGDAETGDLDSAASWLAGLEVERIRQVIHVLTMRFHLRNKSEQVVIAEINRERERHATPDTPRAESIAEAVGLLAREDASLDSVVATLGKLDIQPTLTAHPTEARRRAVLRKQSRIASAVERLSDPRLTPSERTSEEETMRRVLLGLAMTDEVRSERLDAGDEVRNGLHYLAGSIWQVGPTLYSDLRRAIKTYYNDAAPELPTVLRYRSWIGGDRDGNPKVTASVTRAALDQHRAMAIELYLEALEGLRQDLSLSTRRSAVSAELQDAITADAPVDPRHLKYEPYRVRLMQLSEKLRRCETDPSVYDAVAFESDLRMIGRSLEEAGLGRLVASGPLEQLIRRVQMFGLHLAALDIRQHSEVHEAAVDELLRVAGVSDSYASMGEADRLALLRSELSSPRPLVPNGVSLSDRTAQVLETLSVVADALRTQPGSIGSYIVSMTHEVSDLLEVLLLSKESGLYRPDGPGGAGASLLDVAPLFETIDDLRRSEGLLEEAFADPVYRAHLGRRGMLQEIMLGYSDSNKDGGYWVANWLLHRAQREVSDVCERSGIESRLFHGRGGTIGRGGGRANRAILAAPRESRTGRIRFTEQGEVISFRYSLAAIAHRHIEQIINAMVLATHRTRAEEGTPPGAADVMDRISTASMAAYRSLIDDESFWPWYAQATPIAHISDLPLASRPVSRSSGTVDFSRLRAIPWGFAWTQIRATAPGWYGVGSGLRAAMAEDPELMDSFKSWNNSWPFFEAIVANAEQELARARLPITERYVRAAGMGSDDPVLARVRAEYESATALVLEITGSGSLLDRRPVIRDLIRARNPDTDALNLCQIELMGRARAAGDGEKDPVLQSALLASLNGIAAAMQSTG